MTQVSFKIIGADLISVLRRFANHPKSNRKTRKQRDGKSQRQAAIRGKS